MNIIPCRRKFMFYTLHFKSNYKIPIFNSILKKKLWMADKLITKLSKCLGRFKKMET